MVRRILRNIALSSALVLSASDALARIKLITLPVREQVMIQLDHPQVSLVEEERIVPLVEGVNQVDFSWANTLIDPETLVFRVLSTEDHPELEVRVLSVSYPPGENALVWSIFASASGAARVRISYLLGGLDKHFHYRAVASSDETALTLSHYMRIANNANEAYDEANIWPGFGERIVKPIGLNETKEVLLDKYRQVPIVKTYTSDPGEFGYLDRAENKLNVPMHYVLTNDAAHGLGRAALPYGKARIFQRDGRGAVAFLGEDWNHFTPLDDKMELYLGLARDIVVRRTVSDNRAERINGNLYRHDIVLKYEIENFKDRPVSLRIVEHPRQVRAEVIGDRPRDPEWSLGQETTLGSPDAEESDNERIVFSVELPARAAEGRAEQQTHYVHLTYHNEW